MLFMRKGIGTFLLLFIICIFIFFSCSRPENRNMTDKLNTISYEYHYRNIDTSLVYAQRAYNASKSMDYNAGEAEALNNLAFVYMAKMDYDKAYDLLNKAQQITDNQIELLVSDVQFMR